MRISDLIATLLGYYLSRTCAHTYPNIPLLNSSFAALGSKLQDKLKLTYPILTKLSLMGFHTLLKY